MAIPASGNLSIKGSAGTCRSLCTAVVQAGGTGTGALRSLTTQTFSAKANDGSMTQFYGYNPNPSLSIDVDVQWGGGFNFDDGLGGTVRLRASGGALCCTCVLSTFTKYDEWTWIVDPGTYCMDYAAVIGYCFGSSIFISKCWTTDTNYGVGNYTSTFSVSPETVSMIAYP